MREWCRKFGLTDAHALQRGHPQLGAKGPLDEVLLEINGQQHDLGRAVDQQGHILNSLVTARRDTQAATRFFRQVLKRC
jgi:putative transposase